MEKESKALTFFEKKVKPKNFIVVPNKFRTEFAFVKALSCFVSESGAYL